MKHILLSIALLFPTFAVAQQTDEVSECPDHITKVLDLQDVDVTGTRPHYVRLKGYYRSYQWNNSVLKYYNDGIVEYFVDLKKNRSDNNVYISSCMRNNQLVAKDRKRAFTYSDDQTGKPLQMSPKEKSEIIITFCRDNNIPALPGSTELEIKSLNYYNPATLKDIEDGNQ